MRNQWVSGVNTKSLVLEFWVLENLAMTFHDLLLAPIKESKKKNCFYFVNKSSSILTLPNAQ